MSRYRFAAAMRLPEHEGECSLDHGYDFCLTVKTDTDGKGAAGFAVDLLYIDKVVYAEVVDELSNTSLNDTLDHPSLENVARWIGNRLSLHLPGFAALTLEAGDRYGVEMLVGELL